MQTTIERTKLTPREWTISIILHLVVFGLLIWFTPARQVLESLADKKNQPPPKPQHQDPEQVKEVVQSISKVQADAAREHAKELMDMEKKLDKLAKDKLDDYKKQADPIAATAAQKALDLLKEIPPGQDTTMDAQKKLSQQQQDAFSKAANVAANNMDAVGPMRDQLAAAQLAVSQTQVKTEDQQEKALQLMHFLGQDTPAAQAQQKAIDAENAAAVKQQESNKQQQDLVQNIWTLANRNSEVTNEKNRLAQTQAELDAAKAQLTQDQNTVNSAKAQVDAATNAVNQAAVDNSPDGKNKQQQAHQTLNNAQRDLAQNTSHENQAENKVKQLQAQIDNPAGLQRATASQADAQAKFAQMQAQLQATQDASAKLQADAKQAQSDAISQLAAIANTPAATPTPQATPAELATDKEVDASSLDGKDLGKIYEAATQTEDRIANKFRVVRATELASIQKMTLADAIQATQVAKADREKLDTKLLGETQDTKDFNAYKEEVIKAKQQIQSMVATSGSMVSMAEAQKDLGTGDTSLAEDKYNKMVSSATEDDNATGKDLTGMTAESQAQGGGHHGHGGAEEQSSDVDSDIAEGKKGGGNSGDAPPEAGMGDVGAGVASGQVKPELPDMDYEHLKPIATRRFSDTGPHHADWLYVDSWYFIGPFPNAGRANLNTKFPPESIIDLDGAYPGKDGRTLRWVYTQWDSPNLRPAHDLEEAPAIYYAYTELYFDKPQDLWIATGSDDKGTMWLNNVMVWNSNDILKGWTPNEGYRKVHFKQGINRILYRLENGQLVAAFSLMISVKKS